MSKKLDADDVFIRLTCAIKAMRIILDAASRDLISQSKTHTTYTAYQLQCCDALASIQWELEEVCTAIGQLGAPDGGR